MNREKVIKGLETCSDVYYGADGACSSCPYSKINGDMCFAELVHDTISMLKEQPEIVRCKYCAFRDPRDGMCEHVLQIRDPDWYCADGVRRDDDG